MKERNFLHSLNDFAGGIAEKIASLIIKDDYEEIITLKFCIELLNQACAENPEAKYFTLTLDRNKEPENDNDKFIVRLVMKDENRMALSGGYTFHTGKVDDDITELLNDRHSVTVKI